MRTFTTLAAGAMDRVALGARNTFTLGRICGRGGFSYVRSPTCTSQIGTTRLQDQRRHDNQVSRPVDSKLCGHLLHTKGWDHIGKHTDDIWLQHSDTGATVTFRGYSWQLSIGSGYMGFG